jgi:predicted GNAT superfamily acetyltransferase
MYKVVTKMEIKLLTEMSEFEECLNVQRQAWGFEDIDIMPTHLLRTYSDKDDPWGTILGATVEGIIVGFALCLPTSISDTYLLHMIGVLPEYQSQGIGYRLMKELIMILEKRGIKKVVWTCDPLESMNSYLYFRKMGAICRKYVEDYYLLHNSKALSGLPADRFKMELFINREMKDIILGTNWSDIIKIDIPGNFQEIKNASLEAANVLRIHTRQLFQEYITKKNYTVVDFEYDEEKQKGWYKLVLKRSDGLNDR